MAERYRRQRPEAGAALKRAALPRGGTRRPKEVRANDPNSQVPPPVSRKLRRETDAF
jgi:hypothetical protein